MARFDSLRTNVGGGWGTIRKQKSNAPVTQSSTRTGYQTFTSGNYTARARHGSYQFGGKALIVSRGDSKPPHASITADRVHGRWHTSRKDIPEIGRNEHFHAAVNAAHAYGKQVKKGRDPYTVPPVT